MLVVPAFVEGDSGMEAPCTMCWSDFGLWQLCCWARQCAALLCSINSGAKTFCPRSSSWFWDSVFACGTVIVFLMSTSRSACSACQMALAACYANGVNAWIGGGALGALLGGSSLLLGRTSLRQPLS
ncbi:MAG: hypothetical protein ACLVJH_03750 [Faecalibacterium prausnitzii]